MHMWHWFSDWAADREETDMRNGKDGYLYFPVEKYLVNLSKSTHWKLPSL